MRKLAVEATSKAGPPPNYPAEPRQWGAV